MAIQVQRVIQCGPSGAESYTVWPFRCRELYSVALQVQRVKPCGRTGADAVGYMVSGKWTAFILSFFVTIGLRKRFIILLNLPPFMHTFTHRRYARR